MSGSRDLCYFKHGEHEDIATSKPLMRLQKPFDCC
jgi:hypothetical protein